MKRRLLLFWRFWLLGLILSAQGLHINYFELQGEENGTFYAGDVVSLDVEVMNADAVAHEHCTVTVFTVDSNVMFSDDSELFDYIGSGNSYLLGRCVTFQLNPATPDRHVVTLMIRLSSNNSIQDTICSFQVRSCQMECLNYRIVGETFPLILPDETDSLIFTLRNQTYKPIMDVDLELTVEQPGIQVLSGFLHMDTLTAGDVVVFPALLQTDNTFQTGTTFDALISIRIEGRPSTQLRVPIVGISNCERFDTSVMPVAFQSDSAYFGWQIDSTVSFKGRYCLTNETIGNNDTCVVHYSFTITADSQLSFAFKTSSENNYDWLQFYVDSIWKDRWSGERDWTEASYEIPAGTHTVSWYYTKDYSQSVNQDRVWIDQICLSDYAFVQPILEVDSSEIEVTLDRTEHVETVISLSMNNPSDIYLLFDNELIQGGSIPGWVTLTPSNGSLDAHATKDLQLAFTSVNQLLGDYHAQLKLHNSTENSVITIPLTLHIRSGVSVQEQQDPSFELSPNPTTGVFRLSCSDIKMDRVTVYDAFGRQMLSEKIDCDDCSVDIRHCVAGVYFVEIQCGQRIVTLKIIKR